MTSALGHTNLVKTATISATSEEVDMPATKVTNDYGAASTGWQTLAAVTTATLTITMATAGSYVSAIGIFRTNLSATAQITTTIIRLGSPIYTSVVTGVAAGYGQVVALMGSPTMCDSITIEIVDTSNPDGFLNVPLAFAGPIFEPTYPIGRDATYGRQTAIAETVSRGGSEFPRFLHDKRFYKFQIIATDTEAWEDVAEIDRLSRLGGNVLLIPDTASSYLQKEAIYGRLTQTLDVNFSLGAVVTRSWGGMLTERI